MNKMLFSVVSALAAAALAAGNGKDAKGEYYEDDAGAKHYYLFQKTFTGTCWGGAYTYDRTATATTTGGWQNDTIWTFERDTTYGGSLNFGRVCNVYGILFETDRLNGSNKTLYFENMPLRIGAFGVHSVTGKVKMAIYNSSGAKRVYLTESQTWSGLPSDELTSDAFLFVANQPYTRAYTNNVYAYDNVVWTIEGNTFIHMLTYANELTNAEVVVRHPAVMSVPSHTYGTGRLNARKLTLDGGSGLRFGKDTSVSFGSKVPDSAGYGIGSLPLISPQQIAPTIVLTNGATLLAKQATTITGGVTVVSSGPLTNYVSGTFNVVDPSTVFRIEENSTLDLAEASLSGRFSLAGPGDAVVGCSAASGEYSRLPDLDLSGFGGTLSYVVNSGTLVLQNAASLPSGAVVVTEGDGAVLVVDDAGFDAETSLGGSKNMVGPSRLLVTDTAVSGDVVVSNKETLVVFGNGLGADASLFLTNGATVVFRGTASISAPVTVAGTSSIRTYDSSVTGTVAGVFSYVAGTGAEMNFYAPGLLVFSGSGSWGGFNMRSGTVLVTGAYDVNGVQAFYGGHMTVRDGGHVRIVNSWQYLRLDRNDGKDTCLEIADGGIYEKVSGNCYTYVGKNASYESKLLLNGGHFIHKYDDFAVYAGGVIDVEAGTFEVRRRITCGESATAEATRLVLRGGTWYTSGGGAGYAKAMFDGTGSCTVLVDGNATFKYAGQRTMPDSESETGQAVWKCTPGSRLKIENPDFANAQTAFHNFEADGLAIDLNAGSANYPLEVLFADDRDEFDIGFVLPGKAGSKIAAAGSSPALVASYVVPAGQTLDTSSMPTGWYEGFGEFTVSNLTFDAGSTIRFPFFGGDAPLAIPGTLALPDAMNFSVAVAGPKGMALPTPVVSAACGVTGGDGEWTCAGGVAAASAEMSVEGGGLCFAYNPRATLILLR